MHLFIIDLFISLDTVAPLIDGLNKNEQKTKICFVNPLQDFSNHKLINYLNKSRFNKNHGTLCFGIHNKFFFLILKIIMSLPINILKRLYKVWKNIYINKILFNENQLLNFFNKNQITSVTFENSLPSKKRNIIIKACNKAGIPIICIASGLSTQIKDELIEIDFFENINFFLTPNLFASYNKNILNSKKFILCGSPRYDYQWIKKLEEIYNYKYELKNKKLKIAYFTRTTSYNYNQHLELIKKLKSIKHVEVKIGNKPREIVPLKISKFTKDNLSTSELIIWSDIVVSSATSVLVESVQRGKLTVCLEYLKPEKDVNASHFSKHDKVVSIANSSKEVIETINKFNGKSKVIDKNDISLFLDSFIHMKNEGYNIIENIIKYYLNIKTLYKHK